MSVRARFVPPRGDPEAVARPLVQQQLEAASVPLTLLVAPPGFGKTTALAAWLSTQPAGVAYFASRPHDANLAAFVALFVAAMQSVVPGIGEQTLALLEQTPALTAASLAETLADELAVSPQDVTVVIDDLHVLTAPEIQTFLGELLGFRLPTLHLVVASRHDPTFPWARLRLEGQLREIRARDLQLDERQVAHVLQRAGIPDPADHLAEFIGRQAEGWPAGVRAIALALQHGPTPLSGDALHAEAIFTHIDDFLVQEVFTQQSPDVQDALLQLAVFAQFDGELAGALLGDAEPGAARGPLLAELMFACPYLMPEGHPGWVRFHPLFRRFLLAEFARRRRDSEHRALAQRAGELLAARGMNDAAIRLLVGADALDEAAALVEREMHDVLARQDWRTLERWLEVLPEEVIETRPWLMVGRAWISHLGGRIFPLNAYADRIECLLRTSHPDAAEIRAVCDSLRLSTTLPIDREPQAALVMMERAVRVIPASNRFGHGIAQMFLGIARQGCGRTSEAIDGIEQWTSREVERIDAGFIVGFQGKAFVHYWAGQLHACDEAAAAALALAIRHDLPIAAGWARRALGLVAYRQNRLDDAEQHFAAVIADHQRCNLRSLADVYVGQALTLAAQGRLTDANTTLNDANAIMLERQAIELRAFFRPVSALLMMAEDPPDVARSLALSEDTTIDSGSLIMVLHPLVARLQILLMAGGRQHLEEAAAHLATLETRARASHNVPIQILSIIVSVILRERAGDRATAMAELRRAIAWGAQERFLRQFLDLEPLLRPLFRELAERRDSIEGLPVLLAALGSTYDAAGAPAVSPSLALLTLREAEVFDLLADRLTYKEIAYQLSISPQTVKRHVNAIYSKLDVASRREALLKAQELGWHPAA